MQMKETYARPESREIAVSLEGVIAVSPTTEATPVYPSDGGFGTEQDWTESGS